MTTVTPDAIQVATELAKMNVKLDTLLEKSGDHEIRLRTLELSPAASGKNWPVLLTNALMTIANAVFVGTTTIGH